MDNKQKALIYDDCVRETDKLQRTISKIKAENITNMPPHLEKEIKENERKISIIVGRLENLFKE